MKLLFVSLVALFSASAQAAELAYIHCLAANGVLIQGESQRGEPVRTETQWGFFRKDFIASVTQGPKPDRTYIGLTGENGTEYLVALNANPYRRAKQETTGSIYRVSSVKGAEPQFVALVSCAVRFR